MGSSIAWSAAGGAVRLLLMHPPEIIGNVALEKPGRQTLRWPVAAGRGGDARLEFVIGPAYKQLPGYLRPLALQIGSLGFVERGGK